MSSIQSTILLLYCRVIFRELNYHDADAVNARLQGIRDMYANLSQLSQQRADRIQVIDSISLPLHMCHTNTGSH